jgi:Membrane protein involved in the export of O-antigen and teichoic acid
LSERTKSVVKSVSVLSIAGILCKLIGVLFSIPLNMISPEVATDFYLVYPTYTLLLTISSAGLPVAVSRMVAGFLAQGDPENARKTFRYALISLCALGLFFSLLMILFNPMLGRMVHVEETSIGFVAIAPCVLIVCVMSAVRGYFQGQQNMVPTAVSQVMEQVGKVLLSLPLAYFGLKRSVATGAAGALLGITISELFALLYMFFTYRRNKKSFDLPAQNPQSKEYSGKTLLSRLIAISVPITISACIIPFSQFIDSAMMVERMEIAGLTPELAKSSYGLFTSVVIRLINIPTALALAISMSLVPAVAACKARNDMVAARKETDTGMRFAFVIGFPCSVGMSILSHQIVGFFYGGVSSFTPDMIQLASELLTFSAMTVVLFTVVQATSSILQGLRKQKIPMYTMMIGVLIKILLNYILIGTPGINIHGGPYASIACYGIVMILNIIFVCRNAEISFHTMDWLIRPGAAAAIMGLIVWLLTLILPESRMTTILEIAVGIVVYFLLAFLFKALSWSELRSKLHRKGTNA